jgi:hypothetical protein
VTNKNNLLLSIPFLISCLRKRRKVATVVYLVEARTEQLISAAFLSFLLSQFSVQHLQQQTLQQQQPIVAATAANCSSNSSSSDV